jgi:predicted GIY-YIG superfamily endonuclease
VPRRGLIQFLAKPKTSHQRGSTDSRTPEGKARQIAANAKHDNETRAIREERSAKLAELHELEMLGRELGMVEGSWVNRKPPSVV